MKGHDFQFWSAPRRFTGTGDILPLESAGSWTAKVQLGEERRAPARVYAWPKRKDPHPLAINTCTQEPLPPE